MKLAIISTCENYSWAGSEENWVWFAEAALQAGHQVMLGAHWRVARSEQVLTLRKSGLEVTERNPFRPMRLYLLKEKWASDMRALLRFNPDAVFLNAGSPFDYCWLPYLYNLCARLSCPKFICVTFNSELLEFGNRDKARDFYQQMRGVIFVSEQNRSLLQRQLTLKLSNSTIIRNVSRLKLEAPLPWPNPLEPIRFASVARMETLWKGHDTLFQVFSSSKWMERDWRLRLYGTGPDEKHIRRLADYFGLQKRVEFCGWVNGVEKMWETNHALILASRGEGLPLTAVEAMMCGRPVILTPVGGNAEIIDHGVNGFLAKAANEICIDEVLEQAWQNQARWSEIGKAGHETAIKINSMAPGQASLKYIEQLISA